MRAAHDVGQRGHVGRTQDGARRIMRRIDDDQARFCADGGGQLVPRHAVALFTHLHGDQHGHAAGQRDGRQIAVVGRFDDDDFLARMHAAQNGRGKGLRGAGRDGDFRAGIVAVAVQAGDLRGDGLAQGGGARHLRVLVVAGAHGVADQVDQGRVAIEVGKALAQVDGAMLGRQAGHAGKHGGAHERQARGQGGSRVGQGRAVHER